MHRVSFWSISQCLNLFLIVVFESLNCPQCEKMDLKIIQFKYAKDAGNLKIPQDMEDYSEEQFSV